VKVWHAVQHFSEDRAAAGKTMHLARDRRGRTPLERFVYGCLFNLRLDIEKRPRRYVLSIDEFRDAIANFEDGDSNDEARDWFDGRYLSVEAEEVYASVEEEAEPTLPSTLTPLERQVVMLRFHGVLLKQVDLELGLSRARREDVMRSIHEKLADWRPTAKPPRAPTPPLPAAAARQTDARAPLAA
jgi:hypothetical protein